MKIREPRIYHPKSYFDDSKVLKMCRILNFYQKCYYCEELMGIVVFTKVCRLYLSPLQKLLLPLTFRSNVPLPSCAVISRNTCRRMKLLSQCHALFIRIPEGNQMVLTLEILLLITGERSRKIMLLKVNRNSKYITK